MPNLHFIKEQGIKKFIEQQKKKMKLLGTMMKNFDDGRSRSFFCKEVDLLDLTSLESALDKANQKIKIDHIKADDIKIKAKILKGILNEMALIEEIELAKKKS
jgi:hypothetical protein